MSIAEIDIQVAGSVIASLERSLAETNIETLKAQNYHWNVTGPSFVSLHSLFQEIYEDHFQAQDEIAERIRALGEVVDGRYSEFLEVSAIKQCTGTIAAMDMVRTLADDQAILSDTLKRLARKAEESGDLVTTDLAIQRARTHNKFEWMLRAQLQQ